jgi:uncharacterized protein YbcV (DUF1398 family)
MREAMKIAVEKARSVAADYPAFVKMLAEAGIQSYRANVAAHTITYLHAKGETYIERWPESPGPQRQTPNPFNEAGLKAAILDSQRKKIDYPTFMNLIWASGVTQYEVELSARQITYRGAKGETYVERIPNPQ